jgi:hypothetical protein
MIKMLQPTVGADLSRPAPIYRPHLPPQLLTTISYPSLENAPDVLLHVIRHAILRRETQAVEGQLTCRR